MGPGHQGTQGSPHYRHHHVRPHYTVLMLCVTAMGCTRLLHVVSQPLCAHLERGPERHGAKALGHTKEPSLPTIQCDTSSMSCLANK